MTKNHDSVPPADLPDPEAESVAAARVTRLNASREEQKALKAWHTGGCKGTKPATPNLDSITNGEKLNMKTNTKTPTPAPTVDKGQHLVELRNTNHGEVLAAHLGKGRKSKITDRFLIVDDTEAQSVLDELITATEGASEFHRRLLVLGQLYVRHTYPKLTDTRGAAIARLVNRLIADKAKWSVGAKADATPLFTIGGVEHTTVTGACKAAGVEAATPKAKPAKKAPTTPTPAKRSTTAKKTPATSRRRSTKTTDPTKAMAAARQARKAS